MYIVVQLDVKLNLLMNFNQKTFLIIFDFLNQELNHIPIIAY